MNASGADQCDVLVSIVVNNYNNGKFIKGCLDSLLCQSHKNIEVIVVDALSTDNSREVIEEVASADSRIKPIFLDEYEKYPAITYNIGFLNCRGEYIAVNDPDDLSHKDRISRQLNFLLTNQRIDVVGCNCIEFNEEVERISNTSVDLNVARGAPPARNPTVMFRKSCLARGGLWRWQNEYAADFEWLYRWYFSGIKFDILDDTLVRYRFNYGQNISSSKALNQSVKLAKFRIYFGFFNFSRVGFGWWRTLASNLIYIQILVVRSLLKKL